MSESDYDSVDEYTSLMDGHVAESRSDDLSLVNERRKRRSRVGNEEVTCQTFSIDYSLLINKPFTDSV